MTTQSTLTRATAVIVIAVIAAAPMAALHPKGTRFCTVASKHCRKGSKHNYQQEVLHHLLRNTLGAAAYSTLIAAGMELSVPRPYKESCSLFPELASPCKHLDSNRVVTVRTHLAFFVDL